MKNLQKKQGFTLIELMIVVAIIAIIAAIAIPNLLRSRIQSNESAAIGNLRTILGAQTAFQAANFTYATAWDELTTATPPFLDGAWDGSKNGYDFVLGGSATNFSCTATPTEADITGHRGFFTDSSGVIRADDSGAATVDSTPLGEAAAAP